MLAATVHTRNRGDRNSRSVHVEGDTVGMAPMAFAYVRHVEGDTVGDAMAPTAFPYVRGLRLSEPLPLTSC